MIKRLAMLGLFLIAEATASAEFAVIAHPRTALETISTRDLARVFLGKAKQLPDGERAYPAEWQSTALKTAFYRDVAHKQEVELRQYWATMIFTGDGRPPKQFSTIDALLDYVRQTPGAIAYVPRQAVEAGIIDLREIVLRD